MEEKIVISLTSEQIDKFYNNIKIDEQTGCHIYIGCKDRYGYGYPRIGKTHMRAHRIAWYLNNGVIPAEMLICHRCDNHSCVNPDHLFLGTSKDNSQDMVNKGRSGKGEKNSQAKIKEQDVLDILQLVKEKSHYRGLTNELVAKYNLSTSTINFIIARKRWAYLKVE